ncbi:ComF family protein [Afifella sp. IM 167]|uniref:ComF family protein n=1 Tax=Afifella sp. IM 167 TaxID=2033586 RepID=UPI00351D41D5|nr:amidophosphoribosyltransferase [Afifella sp. IM 167]
MGSQGSGDGAVRSGHWLGAALLGAADLLMPPLCPACRTAVGAHDRLCPACWSRLRFIERPFCPVLGVPFSADLGEAIVSAEALADPPPFRRARSAVLFDETARLLVHQLKYRDQPGAAGIVAALTLRAARELADRADLVVPVPLHRFRLWQRRFNQSAEISARLAAGLGLEHAPMALMRTRRTRQQVGLNARERAANMRGAFCVRERFRPLVAGRQVLLVDDVYTSGATIKAATKALLRARAESVDVVTFARAGIDPLG